VGTIRWLVWIPFALALSACSSLNVTTEGKPGADLAAIRTYAWLGGSALTTPDALSNREVRERIDSMIRHHLAAKGLREVAAGQAADVLVQYWVALDIDVVVLPAAGAGLYSSDIGHDRPPSDVSVDSLGSSMGSVLPSASIPLRTGQLAVDLLEPSRRGLLWRATVEQPVTRDLDKVLAETDRGLARAFQGFPPRGN
jgi:hypothetical protein